MNSVLQDILGLIKRRKVNTPSDKDYVVAARYDNPQEVLKPNPKMHPALISLKDLKNWVVSSINISGSGSVGQGWARYDDTEYTSQLGGFTLIRDAGSVVLPNNAGFKIEDQLNQASSFYDGTTQKITPIKVGDAFTMVVTFKASTGNVEQAHIDLALRGGGSTPYDRVSQTLKFTKGNNVEQNFYETFKFYADADFVANGNQWTIGAEGEDVVVWDVIYYIEKTYSAS